MDTGPNWFSPSDSPLSRFGGGGGVANRKGGGSQVQIISDIQTIPYSSQGFQIIIGINNPQKSISGNTGGRMFFIIFII